MQGTVIRRAAPQDLPALAALLDHYFREWDIWERDTPELLRAQLTAPQLGFYLAEQQTTLLGCSFGRPLPSLPHAAECKRLFVLPEARGQGLARRLLQRLEDESSTAGLHWMYLDSKDEFKAALSLYSRAGYTACPRYNNNPQATLFFRKRLP